jgi:hypothetical protein
MRCNLVKNLSLISKDYTAIPSEAYCQNEAVGLLISWCGYIPFYQKSSYWDQTHSIFCSDCLILLQNHAKRAGNYYKVIYLDEIRNVL